MTPGLHDLRHFYAAGLIVAGCDVVTVQRALGHQSAVVTLSMYGLCGRQRRIGRATPSPAKSGTSRQRYTLNLNSTTSPSAMT